MADRTQELADPIASRQEGDIRGNPKTKDSYFIANIKLEYFLSPLGIFSGGNSLSKKPGRNKYNKKRRRR